MSELPPTRWEIARAHDPASTSGYAATFGRLIDEGADIDGEARLADLLSPRNAEILDAGSGIGRVGAALARWGHRVTCVEKDPQLVAEARQRYPDLLTIESDLLAVGPGLLGSHAAPTSYDVIVLVGNVLIFSAAGTESDVLRRLGLLLKKDGRILVGFHPTGSPVAGPDYPWEHFAADVAAAGLALEHRFSSYDLRPANDEYVVAVLTLA